MPDPHERSVASALRTVQALGKLTDRLRGQRSAVHQAYRTVLRALRGNTNNVRAVTDALATLEASVRAACASYYDDAIQVGSDQAQRDLRIYELGEPDDPDPNSVAIATTSTIELLRFQIARAQAIAQLDMGDEYIIGDKTRQGIIRPAPILGEMAFWVTLLSVLSYEVGVTRQMAEAEEEIIEIPVFEEEPEEVVSGEEREEEKEEVKAGVVRQAVAQIDQHTTPCCLAVHGQIVGMKEDFKLTAPPKYASRMHSSPFHRGCRTGIAIILREYLDDEVTQKMRQDAIEQGKKPKPSTMMGRAHYKVVGKSVHEFRRGRWHFSALKYSGKVYG